MILSIDQIIIAIKDLTGDRYDEMLGLFSDVDQEQHLEKLYRVYFLLSYGFNCDQVIELKPEIDTATVGQWSALYSILSSNEVDEDLINKLIAARKRKRGESDETRMDESTIQAGD